MDILNREVLGLLPWLVASWLAAVGVAVLLWLADDWGRPARAVLGFLEGEGWFVAPGEVLAALYGLGVPYAALVTGYLPAEVVGLAGFSWWVTLGRGAVLGVGALLLAFLAWQAYLRTVPLPPSLLRRSRRLLSTPAGRTLFLPWAAAEEFHWAFYRAVPTLLWGPTTGLLAGLLLAAAERYTCPQTTSHLRRPGGIEEEAWWLAKILVMAAMFGALRNLWVCIALHTALEAGVGWLVQRRAAGPAERPARANRPVAAVPVLAGGAILALLAVFTWQAAGPLLASPAPAAETRPTPFVVPTPTPTATPFPTPTAIPPPTATPVPSATPLPTPPRTYVVQAGDTLRDIAQAFNVSVEDLMQVNGITEPDDLQVGQVLAIP